MIGAGHLENIDAAAITSDIESPRRFLITKKPNDVASFKTPTCEMFCDRDPTSTTGQCKPCRDVVDHNNKGDGEVTDGSTTTSGLWR